jgi:nitrogen regulatory protein PII
MFSKSLPKGIFIHTILDVCLECRQKGRGNQRGLVENIRSATYRKSLFEREVLLVTVEASTFFTRRNTICREKLKGKNPFFSCLLYGPAKKHERG